MKEKFMLLDFDSKYAISNYGKIKNVKTNKYLKTYINEHGYVEVQLCSNYKKKNFRVHRLVALTFIENVNNKPYVNHKDGNKTNNCVNNLEWCTAKENDEHARKNGLKVQNKPIIARSKTEKYVFESISEAARFLNTNKGSIFRVLKGQRKEHKGFNFTYYKI